MESELDNQDGFFNETNTVHSIKHNDYVSAAYIVETALDAISRVSGYGYYVIDYHKKNFYYVSDNISYWLGLTADEVKEMGYGIYEKFVPKSDIEMLIEVNNSGFELFAKLPDNEKIKYSITYDFHLVVSGKKRLFFHQLTPLVMKDGKIWLALCCFGISSHQKAGNVVMKKYKDRKFMEYSLTEHSWKEKQITAITNQEKELLRLTARGLVYKEMADIIHLSEETVKKNCQKLMKKFGVNKMAEALMYAINYALF